MCCGHLKFDYSIQLILQSILYISMVLIKYLKVLENLNIHYDADNFFIRIYILNELKIRILDKCLRKYYPYGKRFKPSDIDLIKV